MKVVFKLISKSYCCQFHAFGYYCLNEAQLNFFSKMSKMNSKVLPFPRCLKVVIVIPFEPRVGLVGGVELYLPLFNRIAG